MLVGNGYAGRIWGGVCVCLWGWGEGGGGDEITLISIKIIMVDGQVFLSAWLLPISPDHKPPYQPGPLLGPITL